MRIAIVKLSALGDIVHAMIVLQFIKKFNQEILIDWIVVYQYLESIFSTTEISNKTKLGYLDEYFVKLWDINIFLFGEGLGSYTFWSSNGVLKSVTELTYFEIVRYYGIFGAFFLIVLMLYPALKCLKKSFKTKVVGLAFLFLQSTDVDRATL